MKKINKIQRHTMINDCGCDIYGVPKNNGGLVLIDGQLQPEQQTMSYLSNQNNPYSTMGCGDVKKMPFGNIIPRGLTLQPANVSEWLSMNGYPSARSFTVTVQSTLGAGAVPTTVNLLNETTNGLDNAVTDNGSGAGSIVTTYPDGVGGRAISLLLRNERFGMGAVCIGVAISVTTTGVAVPITGLNARFVTHGIFDNSDLTLSVDTSPTQFCCPPGSLQFMPIKWNIIGTTQFEFLMPGAAGTTSVASITFYFPQN